MVTVQLKGGLGNQLFQYAAGIALSNHLETELTVDIISLQTPDEILGTYRKYKLGNLVNKPVVASGRENQSFFKKIKERLPVFAVGGTVFEEKYFHYDAAFWKQRNGVMLKGNFQSEKYFLPYKNSIISKIQFSGEVLSNSDNEVLSEIISGENLAVHIRRGDYLSNNIANDVLGVLPIAYYEASCKKILEKTNLDKIFVFSDDIAWAKLNLKFTANTYFVESKGVNIDLVDFYLMQQCSHNIVANSTFSWWAAYLNPNPNKIVIAPKRWFNKAPYDTKDLIPDNWIRI